MPYYPVAKVRLEDLANPETLSKLLNKAVSDCLKLMDMDVEVKSMSAVLLDRDTVGVRIEVAQAREITREDEEVAFERWLDQA